MRTEVFIQKTFILLPGFSEEMMSLQITVLDVSAKDLDQWQVSWLEQQVINVIKIIYFGHTEDFKGSTFWRRCWSLMLRTGKGATQESKRLFKKYVSSSYLAIVMQNVVIT